MVRSPCLTIKNGIHTDLINNSFPDQASTFYHVWKSSLRVFLFHIIQNGSRSRQYSLEGDCEGAVGLELSSEEELPLAEAMVHK